MPRPLSQSEEMEEPLVNQAWIGDAVLALYARLKILREDGRVDGEKCQRLTSNQFLGSFGEPTKVEAEVGRVYVRDGLEAHSTGLNSTCCRYLSARKRTGQSATLPVSRAAEESKARI
jgi:hypothetical protein